MKEEFDKGCILYKPQYVFIWRFSFVSLISAIYALYNNYYDIAIVPGGVFVTSITYWWKPNKSWRRNIDILYVKIALFYQIIRAIGADYALLYYLTTLTSIYFFYIGVYYYNKRNYWYSTYAHCMLHLIANIANIILYSGYIVPINDNVIVQFLI